MEGIDIVSSDQYVRTERGRACVSGGRENLVLNVFFRKRSRMFYSQRIRKRLHDRVFAATASDY